MDGGGMGQVLGFLPMAVLLLLFFVAFERE